MLLVKTPEFHRKFLYDLGLIAVFSREYFDAIRRWDNENKLDIIGSGKQPSKTIKFFGSYFNKAYGKNITDIDVIQLIDSVTDERFYMRFRQILSTLDSTPFSYIRFYCGYIKDLEPPWSIGDNGECDFDIIKVENWINKIRISHPNIYEKIKPYLDKNTISMSDLIKADKAIEPYISLTWTREEVIAGYKIHNNVRYDFRDSMITYKRYRVVKLMYKYRDQYCLVDLNIVARDNSIPRSNKDSVTYYIDDKYKKFKYLKKMLKPEFLNNYLEDTRKSIGHITPLAATVELIDKLVKYKIANQTEIDKLREQVKKYAKENDINTVDYEGIQELIKNRTIPIYEKYKNLIKDEFKLDLFIFEIRRRQLEKQVPKNILIQRQLQNFDCTLFSDNLKDIEFIFNKSRNLLLDPYELYDCINSCVDKFNMYISEVIKALARDNYRIIKDGDKYILIKDENKISESKDLKALQKAAIIEN